jgi:hypothetical protein
MAKKSNTQLDAEDYARQNEIRTRTENLDMMKEANEEMFFQTSCQEKELAIYEKCDWNEFTPLNPNHEYETNEPFCKYMKETKIVAFKRAVAKAHRTMDKTSESIRNEEAKISLLSQGVNIGGLSDEEIIARIN